MTNIWALTKVLIKNNVLGFSGTKKKGKKASSKWAPVGFALTIGFCVIVLGLPTMIGIDYLLEQIDLSELLLSYALPIGALTSIIFGSFSVLSVFYFSKDSEQLLPLPIKSSELLVAKFIASLVSEYLILLMFIFPIIFGVGIGINAGILYYLYSLIICVLMPVIPSVIVAILAMLANKVFHFNKKKDLFMYIMTAVILVFSFGYSFGLTYILDGSEESLMVLISGDVREYLKIAKWLFPPANSAAVSLINYNGFIGFASIMTYIGFNILSMVILYFVGDKLYVKGLTANNGDNKKEKKINMVYKSSRNGVMLELIKKEWIVIKRTPLFMLNIVISSFLLPVLFVIMAVVEVSQDTSGLLSEISSFIDFDNSGVLMIILGAFLLVSTMASASSSAISREGKSAKFMKMIPVNLKKQIDAKVYFSMIIDILVLLVMEIPIIIFIKGPWYFWAILNILEILIFLIVNYITLLIDLRKPRLDWMEESEAVKQNFNVFLGILVSMAFGFGLIVLGLYFYLNVPVNIFLLFGFISVILLAIYFTITYLIKKYQNQLFNKVG